MSRRIWREVLAEFLGTFILILLGVGAVVQTVLSRSAAGSYLAINLVWGLASRWGAMSRAVSRARTSAPP